MATEITLGRYEQSEDCGPFKDIYKLLSGTDVLYIWGGYSVGLPCVWELLSLKATLTTDATVANRNFYISSTNNNLVNPVRWDSDDVPASTVSVIALTRGGGFTNMTTSGANPKYATLYPYAFIADGKLGKITIATSTGKSGDSLAIHARFRWLNKELGIESPSQSLPAVEPTPKKWCFF